DLLHAAGRRSARHAHARPGPQAPRLDRSDLDGRREGDRGRPQDVRRRAGAAGRLRRRRLDDALHRASGPGLGQLMSLIEEYTYRAVDPRGGGMVKGTVEASSESAVVSKLRAQGLTPLDVALTSKTGLNREISIP